MQAWEIRDSFGFDHFHQTERPPAELGPGEVRVKVRAVSLNYRDLLMIRGHYNPRQPLPLIPCSDGSGEIVEVGPGVDPARVGERVASCFFQTWSGGPPSSDKVRGSLGGPLDGMLASERVLRADGVVPVPEHLSDAAAATLPCAALTAWSALVTQADVKAGDVVLVQGTGGVSIFALQFACLLGAEVIVTSSSDVKLERARELGAWQTINYRDDPDWGKTARRLTGGRGVDHVVEVGGSGTLMQSLRAVRIGGHISMIGVLSGRQDKLDVVPILMQNIRVQGVLVASRDSFVDMNRAITAHQLEPVVDRVFPFAEAPDAFAHLAAGKHLGKVVIELEST
ncbi:MAG: NAD(P)-dependent alcohol dehydrogenase [Acidobacteriota bacterium]